MADRKHIISQIIEAQKEITGAEPVVDVEQALEPVGIKLPSWIAAVVDSLPTAANPPKVLLDVDFYLDEKNDEYLWDVLADYYQDDNELWSVEDVITALKEVIEALKPYSDGFIPSVAPENVYKLKPISESKLKSMLSVLRKKIEEDKNNEVLSKYRNLINRARRAFDARISKLIETGDVDKIEELVSVLDLKL